MTTTTWPSTLEPQTFSVALKKSGLQFRSPFNGTGQAIDFVAERWVFSLALPPKRRSNSGQVEAQLFNLAGGIERVRCWHFARPQPVGTMRGSPTLSSTASRGNTSLAITGATAGANLVVGGSFEIDTNANGVADGWSVLVGGAGDGGRTHSTVRVNYSYNVIHGGWAQYVEITAAGNAQETVINKDTKASVNPSSTYTLSAYMFSNAVSKVRVVARQYRIDGTTVTGSDSSSGYASTSAMERRSVTFTTESDAAFVEIAVRGITLVNEEMRVDAVQLEAGSTASAYAETPTLKAGDVIGAGGQIFMVTSDTVFSDAGAATVPVINRVRATINSASAVTWDKPTAEFIMPAMQPGVSYRPAILEGVPFDLEEVW